MAKIILFDNQRELSFLYPHFDQVIHSPKSKKLIVTWMKGAWQALVSTKRKDTIVCWFDFQAIILFYLCKFTFQQRNIVAINILLKYKPTLKNRVVRYLYRQALRSNSFKATVTSVQYGQAINSWLGTDCHFTLLHDLYYESYRLPDVEQIKVHPDTVFCGGSNGRDWDFMLAIAKAMPEIKFRLVVTKSILNNLKRTIPENVSLVYDIPVADFVREMAQASAVCNPLDTEAPAGLLVIFRASANDKPIIASDTMVTREYITSGKNGVLLKKDLNAWCDAIRYMLNNQEEAKQMAVSLHESLKASCNETIFASTINELISENK